MKTILLALINNDTSCNKSATRYLYKTHPDLWQEIVATTSFLPTTAKAKQRCWHILNEVLEIPKCPTTGLSVKWHENRYLESFDRSARTTYLNKEGRLKNQTAEAKQKRVESNQGIIDAGLRKPPNMSEELNNLRKSRIKQTWLQKYGVENVFQLAWVKEKSKETLLQKYGVTHPNDIPEIKLRRTNQYIQKIQESSEERKLQKIYYCLVGIATRQNWKNHALKIIGEGVDRSIDNSLDHIYSVQQGFRDNIPPYIIGHYTNLRILPSSVNSAKGMNCDKTQEELFSDFFLTIHNK